MRRVVFRNETRDLSESRSEEKKRDGVRDSVTNEVSSDGGNASSAAGEGSEGVGREGESKFGNYLAKLRDSWWRTVTCVRNRRKMSELMLRH